MNSTYLIKTGRTLLFLFICLIIVSGVTSALLGDTLILPINTQVSGAELTAVIFNAFNRNQPHQDSRATSSQTHSSQSQSNSLNFFGRGSVSSPVAPISPTPVTPVVTPIVVTPIIPTTSPVVSPTNQSTSISSSSSAQTTQSTIITPSPIKPVSAFPVLTDLLAPHPLALNKAITPIIFTNTGSDPSLNSGCTGTVPNGLKVGITSDKHTCQITGTPKAYSSTQTYTIYAKNSRGSSSARIYLSVERSSSASSSGSTQTTAVSATTTAVATSTTVSTVVPVVATSTNSDPTKHADILAVMVEWNGAHHDSSSDTNTTVANKLDAATTFWNKASFGAIPKYTSYVYPNWIDITSDSMTVDRLDDILPMISRNSPINIGYYKYIFIVLPSNIECFGLSGACIKSARPLNEFERTAVQAALVGFGINTVPVIINGNRDNQIYAHEFGHAIPSFLKHFGTLNCTNDFVCSTYTQYDSDTVMGAGSANNLALSVIQADSYGWLPGSMKLEVDKSGVYDLRLNSITNMADNGYRTLVLNNGNKEVYLDYIINSLGKKAVLLETKIAFDQSDANNPEAGEFSALYAVANSEKKIGSANIKILSTGTTSATIKIDFDSLCPDLIVNHYYGGNYNTAFCDGTPLPPGRYNLSYVTGAQEFFNSTEPYSEPYWVETGWRMATTDLNPYLTLGDVGAGGGGMSIGDGYHLVYDGNTQTGAFGPNTSTEYSSYGSAIAAYTGWSTSFYTTSTSTIEIAPYGAGGSDDGLYYFGFRCGATCPTFRLSKIQ